MNEELILYQVVYKGAKPGDDFKGQKDQDGSPISYVVSNKDQIRRILDPEKRGDFLNNATSIEIKALGPVNIDKLTLERLTADRFTELKDHL